MCTHMSMLYNIHKYPYVYAELPVKQQKVDVKSEFWHGLPNNTNT